MIDLVKQIFLKSTRINYFFLCFAFTTLIFLSGYSPYYLSTISVSNNDVKLTQSIYDENDWKVRESKIQIKVHESVNKDEPQAIQIKIKGNAFKKAVVEDQRKFISIPVALFESLPPYFTSNTENVELLTYKVKEGLWSLVANYSTNNNVERSYTKDIEPKVATFNFNLDIVMVSPAFSEQLPFYICIGDGSGLVETIITIPKNSKFTSLDINDNNGSTISNLVLLPLSLSDSSEEVQAIAQLSPQSSIVWNLSGIRYDLPNQ